MKIGVDQGLPRGNLGKDNEGKFFYKLNNGKFDIDKFNRDFSQYIQKRKTDMKEILDQKLERLNKPVPVPLVYNLPVGQIIINIKDAFFDILDDIVNFKVASDTFTRSNRMFYVGIVCVIVALLLYFYLFFICDGSESKSGPVINIDTH